MQTTHSMMATPERAADDGAVQPDDAWIRTHAWAAAYHASPIPEYQGNPLIETLPPLLSRERLTDALQRIPPYANADRRRPPQERLPLLLGAARFFQPLPDHLDLATIMSAMLREGYVSRNPCRVGYWQESRTKLRSAFEYDPQTEEEQEEFPVAGLTLLGISGIGKSRAMTRALRLYPQVIEHAHYNGRAFSHRQLVYVKLDCPPDGSRAGLCKSFFRQVDRHLGTHYYAHYALSGRPTVDSMLVSMGNVCIVNSIGVLVIDEVQNLREAKQTDIDRMLNFFTTLDNEIGVPVILIGTPRAREILAGGFRRARRAEGQGGLEWDRMHQDATWDLFLEALWRYQYTDEHTTLDDELRRAFYDESQGIADIAIKLFVLTQMRVIDRRYGCISAAAVQKTAHEHLRFVRPFLMALRTNDTFKLEKGPAFEDLRLPNLDDIAKNVTGRLTARPAAVGSPPSSPPPPPPASPATPLTSPTSPAPAAAQHVGVESAGAAPATPARDVSGEVAIPSTDSDTRMSRSTNDSDSARMSRNTGEKRAARGRRTREPKASYQEGLLKVLLDSRASNTTPYEALKVAGFIRSAEEYLGEEAV